MAINMPFSPVIAPEIYIGENYFTVKGVIEQNKPTHIPWISLPMKSVLILGIRTKIPANIATEFPIIKF